MKLNQEKKMSRNPTKQECVDYIRQNYEDLLSIALTVRHNLSQKLEMDKSIPIDVLKNNLAVFDAHTHIPLRDAIRARTLIPDNEMFEIKNNIIGGINMLVDIEEN